MNPLRQDLSGRGPRAPLGVLVAALATLLSGCVRITDSDDTQRTDVNELRALPYVSFSEEEADLTRMGVMHHVPEKAQPGYNLYTIRPLCRVEMIDMEGNLVHEWVGDPCGHWYGSELLPNGDLLLISVTPGDGRTLRRLDWDGNVVWKTKISAHHDVEVTPRGQILAMTYGRPEVNFSGRSLKIRDDVLMLLDPEGEILETKSLYAFLETGPPDLLEYVPPKKGTDFSDLLHANAVEWMAREHLFDTHPIYAPGHVLVTLRHQDLVVILDWDAEKLVWWWGKGEISGPHDSTLLENGNILIFDNGLGHERSRLVELDPVRKEIVWEFQAPNPQAFYSRALGSAQRLENGNTLAGNSVNGQGFEVTPEGEVVWDFYVPHIGKKNRRAVFIRIKRFAPELIEPLLGAPAG